MQKTYDVIIAGAGPVGLFLACELGLAKVSVLVLERDPTPHSPWKAQGLGLRGLNTPSVEAFYRRGMLDGVISPDEERELDLKKTNAFQHAGHFAGIMIDGNKVDRARFKYRLSGPALLPSPTTLEQVESTLAARAHTLGVTIVRGEGVASLVQEHDGVAVCTSAETTYRGKWLVGCDGGRSVVRKAAGFEFVGTEAEFTGYIARCVLDHPEKLQPGFCPTKQGMYITMGPEQIYLVDFDGGRFDRSDGISREHLEEVLRRISCTDVGIKELVLANAFTDRCKQATAYRKGRVLLAGDAAHIHSPLGGQGLNLGLGDAMNLGWKLAATIHGKAPEGLLDTYFDERHPLGAWVLDWTRAQVAALRPTLAGQAVGTMVRELIDTVDGATYYIDRMWGLSQRYDLDDPHPLVGRSAPDFAGADGVRLGSKFNDGRGLLVDFKSDPTLKALASRWPEQLNYVALSPEDALGLSALIVRPDGIVAWVAEGQPEVNTATAALKRWFGD